MGGGGFGNGYGDGVSNLPQIEFRGTGGSDIAAHHLVIFWQSPDRTECGKCFSLISKWIDGYQFVSNYTSKNIDFKENKTYS